MPKESLSVYIDIKSGSSERTLTSLADKTRALDKETQELNQTTEEFTKATNSLMKEQTRLQSEMKASQKTVNDLQKAYDEYGDELSKLKLDQAIENHAKLKSELAGVNSQISANQRSYKDYFPSIRLRLSPAVSCRTSSLSTRARKASGSLPNGRNGGKGRSGR